MSFQTYESYTGRGVVEAMEIDAPDEQMSPYEKSYAQARIFECLIKKMSKNLPEILATETTTENEVDVYRIITKPCVYEFYSGSYVVLAGLQGIEVACVKKDEFERLFKLKK